jgi:uncharacterized protein YndB with AHSA1/START domain
VIKENSIRYELGYPHPPERVWRALVDPAELAGWLMPSLGFAAVVGQRFTMSCDPFGEIDAEVLECDPPRRLALQWLATFGKTLVTFELAPAGPGTLLTLVHSGWADTASGYRDQFDSGWQAKLGDGLLAVLGRGGRAGAGQPG